MAGSSAEKLAEGLRAVVQDAVREELERPEGVLASIERNQLKLLDMVRTLDTRQRPSGGPPEGLRMAAKEAR